MGPSGPGKAVRLVELTRGEEDRMPDVVDVHISTSLRTGRTLDEAAARRSLRGQIAKLERELAAVFANAYPRRGLDWRVTAPGGPRVLGVGDLEEVRDRLAARLEDTRRTLRDRGYVERRNLERIEEMLEQPARFKWVRISNADIG